MKNKQHFLSVIVPVYKQEKTISKDLRNINRILKQIRYDYEIIAVVDGRRIDKSYSKIKQLKLEKIKVFTYKNNLEMNVIAFFIHSGISMFWGIIFSFLFTKVFSSDYYLLKILFMSFCIFFFHLGFLDEPFHYKREIHKQTTDLLIIMSGYLIYGFLLTIIFKKQKIIRK